MLYCRLVSLKRTAMKCLLIVSYSLICFVQVYGQSLPVGTPVLEDAYRRAQLHGTFNESVSFSIRPLSLSFLTDRQTSKKEDSLYYKILPLTFKQQYNSDHPEGLNDGAMIPARGYQSLLSGGVFAKYRWLSVQLMPEFVFAENRAYQGFPDELSNEYWQVYFDQIVNKIDIPERFGNTSYKKAFWGQSSIRATFDPISIGLSNENLWWGPGMQNSLLMTNNAPGFKHITINTVRPIRTVIGSFEGQLVGGRLDASGYSALSSARLAQHNILPSTGDVDLDSIRTVTYGSFSYTEKPKDWRYLNGLVLTYQPRWLPGLFLGAARSYISYHSDKGRNSIDRYLPVISSIGLEKVLGVFKGEVLDKKDQLASVFMRWVVPKSDLEIYGEFGREDHATDVMDLMLEPDHSSAYILGFRKMSLLNEKNDEYIDIQAEIAQFSENLSTWNRVFYKAAGWYYHHQILDGYTNNGQYLGAGIGTSSNMQSLNISWIKKMKRVGLEMKRVAHEENFWSVVSHDSRTHWVDFGGAIVGDWDYKQFLFSTKMQLIGSNNYQFLFKPVPSDFPLYAIEHGVIRYNVHVELGVSYLF